MIQQVAPISTVELLVTIATYIALGAIVNGGLYFHSMAENGEPWNPRKAAPMFAFGGLAGLGVYLTGGTIEGANIEPLALAIAVAANAGYEAMKDIREAVAESRDRGESPEQQFAAGAGVGLHHADRLNGAWAGVKHAYGAEAEVEGDPPADDEQVFDHEAEPNGAEDQAREREMRDVEEIDEERRAFFTRRQSPENDRPDDQETVHETA